MKRFLVLILCNLINFNSAASPFQNERNSQIDPYELKFQVKTVSNSNINSNYAPNQQQQRYPDSFRHSNNNYRTNYESPRLSSSNANYYKKPFENGNYDPFYFNGSEDNVRGLNSNVRNRRNSKYDDLRTGQQMLDEKVHFFRRGPPDDKESRLMSESGEIELLRNLNFEKERMALYAQGQYRQPYYEPRMKTYDAPRELYYRPEMSNYIDNNRYSDGYGYGDMRRLMSSGGRMIDGMSVQVGTQLRVHDDGSSRSPGQFYVRDEKPMSLSRYPMGY